MSNIINKEKKQEICEFYSNIDDLNKFNVGFLLGFDENFYIYESIDSNGFYDGIICAVKNELIKIQTNTTYLQNLNILIKFRDQKHIKTLPIKDWLKMDFIKYIKKNEKLCEISLCNSNEGSIIGFVDYICEDIIKIKMISDKGILDGFSEFDINDISFIAFDTIELNSITILFNSQNK